MSDFDASLLIGTLRVTIKHARPALAIGIKLDGQRIRKFTSPVRQNDRKQHGEYFVSQQLIEPVKDLCDAPGGVAVTDECKHQRAVSEVDSEEHLSALAPFDRIHFCDGNVRVGSDEFQEILIGAAYMALLIDTDRLFLLAHPVPHFPGKIDVSDGKEPGIDVIVDGFLVKHDVIRILDAYVMDRLSLLHEGSNDRVYTPKFFFGCGKALAAFAEHLLVFLLGVFGIVKMSLELAAVPLCAAIADVWRLKDGKTMLFLEIRADLVTGFHTATTVLSETIFAGFTDIPFVGAVFKVQTWIECSFLYNLEVTFDLLCDSRGVLPKDQPYRLK